MAWDVLKAAEIIDAHRHLDGATLPVLRALQEAFGYLPEEATAQVADALNLSRAEVHGVISFYHDFRRAPIGRTSLKLCRERFIAYNRILIAISNLKNLGRVSDVDDMLRSIAERDESAHETSFGLLNGFLWAIPVLGFIGTVLGLGLSIASFSSLLSSQSDMSGIVASLKEVTGGLSTAFDTTLLALVIALFLQLWMTIQKSNEERFLDDCSDYCMKQIVSRIKILPYEQAREV